MIANLLVRKIVIIKHLIHMTLRTIDTEYNEVIKE